MKIGNFRPFLVRHLPYWLIISGLATYIFIQNNRDDNALYYQTLKDNLNHSTEIIGIESQQIYNEIESDLRLRQSPASARFIRQARVVDNARFDFERLCSATEDKMDDTENIGKELFDTIIYSSQKLLDILIKETNNDTLIHEYLIAILEATQSDSLFYKNGSTAERKLWLKHWKLKGSIACFTTAYHLSKYAATLDYVCNFTGLYIAPETVVPVAGEVYKTGFFLSNYVIPSIDLKAKINGKPIAIRDGLARFETRYSTPGRKEIEVEFEWTDWLQNEKRNARRTFEIMVQKPCLD